jgi:hypothetical protein
MNRDITKADDIAPWHFSKARAQWHRNTSGSLADDRELVQHGAAHEIIAHETLDIHTADESFNRIYGLDDVGQVEPITPHTGPRHR